MPRLTPAPTRQFGHGASLPPRAGGGGDDPGRDNDDHMPNYGDRLRRARKGMAIAVTPILVLFVSFTSAYLIQRGFAGFDETPAAYAKAWAPVKLPWMLLLFSTAVLVASSVTIVLARRGITREAALAPVQSIPGISLGDERQFPWLAVTTTLGLLFLAGQLLVWRQLSAAGFHLTGGTSSSFVYILTAMHSLHFAGGILALLFADAAAALHRPVETRRLVVDITSWYWHCMTGLWIYILLLFSLAA